jgi:hypothetical protein
MWLSMVAGFTSFLAVMVCIAVNLFGHPEDI